MNECRKRLMLICLIAISFCGCEILINPEIKIQVNTILDFGDVGLGNQSDMDLTIFNIGDNPLIIYALVFQNYGVSTSATEFSISSGWSGQAVTISSGQSHILTIRFEPESGGSKSVELAIKHNATNELSPSLVNITGIGVVPIPQFQINPGSHDFGSVFIINSVDQNFIVSNPGTGDLVLSTITISGTHSSEFSIIAGGFWPRVVKC